MSSSRQNPRTRQAAGNGTGPEHRPPQGHDRTLSVNGIKKAGGASGATDILVEPRKPLGPNVGAPNRTTHAHAHGTGNPDQGTGGKSGDRLRTDGREAIHAPGPGNPNQGTGGKSGDRLRTGGKDAIQTHGTGNPDQGRGGKSGSGPGASSKEPIRASGTGNPNQGTGGKSGDRLRTDGRDATRASATGNHNQGTGGKSGDRLRTGGKDAIQTHGTGNLDQGRGGKSGSGSGASSKEPIRASGTGNPNQGTGGKSGDRLRTGGKDAIQTHGTGNPDKGRGGKSGGNGSGAAGPVGGQSGQAQSTAGGRNTGSGKSGAGGPSGNPGGAGGSFGGGSGPGKQAHQGKKRRGKLTLAWGCDGTNLNAETGSSTQNTSNVWNLIKMMENNANIRAKYHIGPASDPEDSMATKVVEKMLGTDVPKIIQEGYTWLCEEYQKGDDIILIGFSRGAFIARCIASLINFANGLMPKKSLTEKLSTLFNLWETEAQFTTQDFQDIVNADVKHLVLFDTVASVWETRPSEPAGFLHAKLLSVNSKMEDKVTKVVSQALAVHEHRNHFMCIPITDHPKTTSVEQMWFPGFHSNIGGGIKEGLVTLFTLAWMMGQIKKHDGIDLNLGLIKDELSRDFKNWPEDSNDLESKKNIFKILGDQSRIPAWQEWVNGETTLRGVNDIDNGLGKNKLLEQMHVSARLFVDDSGISDLVWPEEYHVSELKFNSGKSPKDPAKITDLLRDYKRGSVRGIEVEGKGTVKLNEGFIDKNEYKYLFEIFKNAADDKDEKLQRIKEFIKALGVIINGS